MSDPKIVSVTITHPKKMGQSTIYANMDNGENDKFILAFYSDEVSFIESEIVGMTRREVGSLFVKKDTSYLQR